MQKTRIELVASCFLLVIGCGATASEPKLPEREETPTGGDSAEGPAGQRVAVG